jgi:integrase
VNIPSGMRPVTQLRPGSLTETMTELSDWADVVMFCVWMETAKLSPRTIRDRLEILRRLQRFLGATVAMSPAGEPSSGTVGGDVTHATRGDLEAFQASYRHLACSSVNVYTRNIRSFYRWAIERGLIDMDPSASLPVPKVHQGQPHPATGDQVRTIFACTTGPLRLVYALAAFAGLRCGEICQLQSNSVDTLSPVPVAVVHGKGGRQRTVPILPPLAVELAPALTRRGWVVRKDDGTPFGPRQLSCVSSRHLAELGVDTTLHSLRHSFATWAARATRDPLLVRDLLGHASVATTEIYMQSAATQAHEKLGDVSALAGDCLGVRRLASA